MVLFPPEDKHLARLICQKKIQVASRTRSRLVRSSPLFPPLERDVDVNWVKIIKMESKSFAVLVSIVPFLQDKKYVFVFLLEDYAFHYSRLKEFGFYGLDKDYR